jgi:hypothetical protein
MWPDLYRCSTQFMWFACWAAFVSTSVGQQPAASPIAEMDRPATSLARLDQFHQPLLRQDLKINGAVSCAASSCHAGPRPGIANASAARGMEYQLWLEQDPHAQSWRTLCSDESVAMMRRLKIMEGDAIVDRQGFDNCLACHNTTKRYDEPRRSSLVDSSGFADAAIADVQPMLREGVGCAGCHGPSERWIDAHYRRDWSAQGASQNGFVEVGDLYVRARMCAACHIGDKDRDMNHDIIAAGHPTLRFELATFHAWQPKHWRDAEASDKTFYEAQLWLAGQIAATDAALSLLQARAQRAHSVSKWPELAAYNCASCHHRLSMGDDRRSLQGNRAATAIYSDWNDAGLRWLIAYRIESGAVSDEDSHLIAALDRVKSRMEESPRPSAEAVAEAAAHAREVLAEWFDSSAGQYERTRMRSDRLGRVVASAAGRRSTFQNWESAVQFYLAAVAARQSWPGGGKGAMQDVADRMRHGLSYPEMIDISRYARRSGSGPRLNRLEAMRLGVELAGWLGPVSQKPSAESPQQDDLDGRTIQAEIDALFDEITERWRAQPAPPRLEPPTQRSPRTPRDQPTDPQPRRRSLEELRESLEKLQSSDEKTDQ